MKTSLEDAPPIGGMTSDDPEIIAPGDLGPVIGRGRKADVHALGEGRVVKLFTGTPDAREIAAEFAATRAAAASGAPAPRVFGMAEIEGHHGIVMERVKGESLLDLLEVRPVRRFHRTAAILAELAAEIGRCPAAGLVSAQVRFGDYCSSDLIGRELRERTAALMERLPAGDRLVHGDLHPGNVMLTANGPVAIDWQWTCSGPLGADAAFTRQNIASRVQPPARKLAERGFRRALSALYTARYLRQAHADPAAIAQWEPIAFVRRLGPLSRDGVRDLDTPLAALLARVGA